MTHFRTTNPSPKQVQKDLARAKHDEKTELEYLLAEAKGKVAQAAGEILEVQVKRLISCRLLLQV